MLTLLLLAIPLIAAGLLFSTGAKNARQVALVAGILELIVTVVAFIAHAKGYGASLLSFDREWIGPLGISYAFQLDGISLVMALLVSLLLPLIVYASCNRTFKNPHYFYGLMLLMAASMIGAFITTDGLLFYVFYEFALIPIYFMILYWSEAPDKNRITLKFFIYTLFGSLFMLVSLLYLYNLSGSFRFEALYQAGRSLSSVEQGWVFAGFFVAFAVKIPVFPFHSWQPSTYDAAPTAGTMLLAGIMLKMASYGMLRIVVPALPEGISEYGTWALVASAISVLYASCMAIAQQRYKLLIAWSSIAHLGVLSAGILSGNAQGLQGGVMEMLSHGILSVALFFVYDILEQRLNHDNMHNMGGIRQVNPTFAFLFFVIVMGSVALPLTSGFVGEFLLLMGFYQVSPWLTAVAGLTVVLGAVYMLRSFQIMMLGSAQPAMQNFATLTRHESYVLTICVVLIIALGIYPDPILSVANPTVESLLQGLNR